MSKTGANLVNGLCAGTGGTFPRFRGNRTGHAPEPAVLVRIRSAGDDGLHDTNRSIRESLGFQSLQPSETRPLDPNRPRWFGGPAPIVSPTAKLTKIPSVRKYSYSPERARLLSEHETDTVLTAGMRHMRSEEHTSELQSLRHLVC